MTVAPSPHVIDLQRARRETPGIAHALHLNSCGAALMPAPVLDAVQSHLALEATIGGYEAADRARGDLECVYDELAALLGCARDEVAVVENATRGWDMAFYSIPFRVGDRILTSRAEYASNYLAFLQVARRTGAVVEPVPDDEHGQLDVNALRQLIDGRVKLIAVTHVPTGGGLVNPAAAIGAVARAHQVPFLLDACQSVGQMPIDVEAWNVDLLSGTSRKYLRGPRGVGFLYVRRALLDRLEPPFLDLHAAEWVERDRYVLRGDARRFENWECNVAGKIGLGVAVAYARAWGLEAIQARVNALAQNLRGRLEEQPGVEVLDRGVERCGIVTFRAEGRDAAALVADLASRRINVSTSTVLSTRLDFEGRGIRSLVRAGVHYYNSEEEIERFVATLWEMLI